jgi:hypothetical protein
MLVSLLCTTEPCAACRINSSRAGLISYSKLMELVH